MALPLARKQRLLWIYWFLAALILSILGFAAVFLPSLINLTILAVTAFIICLFVRPSWVLIALLLIRSSADISQSLFTLFPSSWYSFNLAGVLNITAVGVGIIILFRRFVRGQKLIPSVPLIIYALFLTVAAIGIINSIDIAVSVKEWARLAGSLGIALLVIEIVRNQNDVIKVLRIITIAAIPPLLIGYYQVITTTGYFFEGSQGTIFAYRPQGTFGHPAILATFLILVASLSIISLLMSYPLWPKPILIAFAGASLGLLILTYARTEWLGALAAFGFIGLVKYRRIALIVILVILLLTLTVPSIQMRLWGEKSSESIDWRKEVWGASMVILQEPTWFGTGLDTSPFLINKQLPRVYSPPHNDYLKTAIEMGMVGVVALMLLQGSFIVEGWKAFRHGLSKSGKVLGFILLATTIAGIVINLSDNYLGYVSYQWYFWAVVASLAALQSTKSALQGELSYG